MPDVLEQLGGVATRAELIRATSRAAVDHALASGEVVALARGRYALPSADEAVKAAHRLAGVLDRFSAALHHGWPVWQPPTLPQVAVPRHRIGGDGADISRPRLGPDDVSGIATSVDRTLADCLRADLADALAVADSALRAGVSPARLAAIARDLRGPGSARARRVAAAADARSANPFESALRAIALDVPGLHVEPQVPIRSGHTFLGRPDLVDERLGIVLEADSFSWHGDRGALARDARRYNQLAVNGWLVLRFSWEEVHDTAAVRLTLLAAAVQARTNQCTCGAVIA